MMGIRVQPGATGDAKQAVRDFGGTLKLTTRRSTRAAVRTS